MVERDGENIAVIVSLRVWQRHRAVGERLDALGAEYRLAADKQRRAEELLAAARLTRAEEKELEALLDEADKILLRRAEALDGLWAASPSRGASAFAALRGISVSTAARTRI